MNEDQNLTEGVEVTAGMRNVKVTKERGRVILSVCTNGYQAHSVRIDPDMVAWVEFALRSYLRLGGEEDAANFKNDPDIDNPDAELTGVGNEEH